MDRAIEQQQQLKALTSETSPPPAGGLDCRQQPAGNGQQQQQQQQQHPAGVLDGQLSAGGDRMDVDNSEKDTVGRETGGGVAPQGSGQLGQLS